jgi:serine/threonine protein kinase
MPSMDIDSESFATARHWCESKGPSWSVSHQLGPGGTARVFEITSPQGARALKIYDADFSAGKKGEIEQNRIVQQLALKGHDCPFLVQIYEGGKFGDRLYLLMSRAEGTELEKCLGNVPRDRIRQIVGQIANAALFLKSRDLCHRDIKAANIFISNDFNHATLLDISVIRNIYDPVGAGSDRDGQLPVLATARYSPPEYLFRLLEPGPKLWHALNVYQLGALLHDLIMREPLFQIEYLKSAENRYRFAWTIATAIPTVQGDDVDQDLVFTARRALDKDWEQRSTLSLEDFLADSKVQQVHALQLLGLTNAQSSLIQDDSLGDKLQRIRQVSANLEEAVLMYLRKNGVTAIHEVRPGATDTSRVLVFRWAQSTGQPEMSGTIQFELVLSLTHRPGGDRFGVTAKLSVPISEAGRRSSMELPELDDEPTVEIALAREAESAFRQLAMDISRASVSAQGV